ncbi:MAG: ATP-dependent helicase [Christensenellales bacterium]
MDYTKLLNPEQLKPVLDTEGAVLVLAGAGSGKTRVLTYRIAYLIEEKGVAPHHILAITFTNKAAGEMKERVYQVTGRSEVTISTFHALCARILRAEIENIEGFSPNFTIYDDADCTKIVKRIIGDIGMDTEKDFYKTVRWHISNAKNHALAPEAYGERIKIEHNSSLITEIYKIYEQTLVDNNALDFDDLLLKTVKLFTSRPDILNKYQERFQYIHVDEFQDTNRIQYMLVRMLSMKYGNVFAVGDDDQSIYGWRWAEVHNVKKFHQEFAGCRLYKLEQNYRSTGNILAVANKIIANNSGRVEKNLWTEGSKGTGVIYRSLSDEKTEADYVIEQITALMRYNGYSFSDFAVLYRANAISRSFEEKLALYNYPYKVVGGNKFFDRKEIKDFLAYLKFVANPSDSESILRVINTPKRGIGDGAISKIMQAAQENGLRLYDAIKKVHALGLPSATANNIAKFSDVIIRLESVKDMPLGGFIDQAREIIDFESAYDKKVAEDANRLDNIDDFVTAVKEYCRDNENPMLEDFLQSVSLLTDNDRSDDENSVTLATVHGVKGLEFRCVFVVGLEDGLFPVTTALADDEALQEERRIMYVAVTRAKERLYLTNAFSRFRYGHREYGLASRFLKEGGLEKEREDKKPYGQYYEAPKSKIDYTTISKPTPAFATARPCVEKGRELSKFKEGQIVRHSRFGEGKIVEILGENARIEFAGLGVKTFNMRLAPIEIIEG